MAAGVPARVPPVVYLPVAAQALDVPHVQVRCLRVTIGSSSMTTRSLSRSLLYN